METPLHKHLGVIQGDCGQWKYCRRTKIAFEQCQVILWIIRYSYDGYFSAFDMHHDLLTAFDDVVVSNYITNSRNRKPTTK